MIITLVTQITRDSRAKGQHRESGRILGLSPVPMAARGTIGSATHVYYISTADSSVFRMICNYIIRPRHRCIDQALSVWDDVSCILCIEYFEYSAESIFWRL